MAYETFSLADTYGRGVADKQDAEYRQSRNQLAKRKEQYDEILRTTGQKAANPETGEYSPSAHARALAQAGYPQVGEEILGQQRQRLDQSLGYFERVLPYLSAENYPTVRQQAEQAGYVAPGMLPEQYDPQVIEQLYARAKGQQREIYGAFEEIAKTPEGTRIYGQKEERSGKFSNVTTARPPADGDERGRGPPSGYRSRGDGSLEPIPGGPADKKTGGRFSLKASDSNAIYRQAVGFFGGTYDPLTGRISGLNPQQAEQVQRIAARAAQMFQESEGGLDHASAVENAFGEVRGGGAPEQPTQRQPGGAEPVKVSTPEEYARLPSGSQYVDPNGQTRAKR